jgi:hypothetical protein
MSRPPARLLVFALLALPAPAALGGYVSGVDAGAGPFDPRPNSTAAEAQFLQATAGGTSTLITFEGLSAGQPADGTPFALTTGGTVTASTTHTDHPAAVPPGFQFGITDSPNTNAVANNATYGFSTSGTQHFMFSPVLGGGTSSFDLHSAAPFASFGFYLTGVGNHPENGTLHLRFNDGADQDQVIAGSPLGGVLFFGYVGSGAPITDLHLVMTGVSGPNRDVFGIDDVRLVSAVPAPPAFVLMGVGLAAWLGGRSFGARSRRG